MDLALWALDDVKPGVTRWHRRWGGLPVHIEAIWALGAEPYSHRHQFLILLWDGPICQGGLVES